jgi:hypothetical protein
MTYFYSRFIINKQGIENELDLTVFTECLIGGKQKAKNCRSWLSGKSILGGT